MMSASTRKPAELSPEDWCSKLQASRLNAVLFVPANAKWGRAGDEY